MPIQGIQELGICDLCLIPFKRKMQSYTINEDRKCGHKFHKKCIKDYINKKCTKIYGRRVKCPVVRCKNEIILKQALKILGTLNEIYLFECNLYIARKLSQRDKWASFVKFVAQECTWSSNEFCRNSNAKLQWLNVIK